MGSICQSSGPVGPSPRLVRQGSYGLGLVVALYFWVPMAFAQDSERPINQFSHETWQNKNGLPQNSVHAVVQTRDGYLWMGTQEGLVRFDGVRFVVFDRTTTPQIQVNHILALCEDKDGTLWIGTYGGGLVAFRDGRFRSYGASDGLPGQSIMALAEDRAGALWIATQDAGVTRRTAQGFKNYTTAQGLGSLSTSSVAVDSDGLVWVGTASGLSQFDQERFVTFTARDGLATDTVTALAGDAEGSLWVGTDVGLTRWRRDGVVTYAVQDGLAHNSIRALYVDAAGSLWVGTHGGVTRLSRGQFSSITSRDGLLSESVISVFQDREGSYWIGTDGGGVSRWRDASFVSFGTRHGLLSERIVAITGSSRGGFWVGTDSGQIYQFQNNRFVRLPTDEKAPIPNTEIRALLEDRQGNLWIGGPPQLLRWREGQWVVYDRANGLPSFPVRVIFEDREGRIWVGTRGGGLSRVEGDRLVTFTTRDGLADDRVRAMLQDKDGALWIGTYGGLTRWQDGKFTVFTTAHGLSHNFVRTLELDDEDGTLWIGTYGGGLDRMRNGRINTYRTRDGLRSDGLFQILDDRRGSLWMSCNLGVFRVDKSELEDFAQGRLKSISSTAFDEADGMENRECNGGSPAGWRTEDGRLWFPTLQGVAMVDPGRLRRNALPPPVVLEEVRVEGRLIQAGEHLPAGSERFEFHFTGLSFVAPSRMRFAYQLEGFDPGWIDAGLERSASYTFLPSRKYRFQVKAANNDGVWSTTIASFDFTLRPHLYQTRWFYGLCGLLLVAAGAGIYHLRARQLLQRQRELQAKIDDAVSQIKTLQGLLPICAWCKRVRDDRGYWNQIEVYIRDHSQAEFSHGICPDCVRKFEFGDESDHAKGSPGNRPK